MRILLAILVSLMLSACALLQDRVSRTLNAPEIEGTRWGLVVTTMDGRELIAIRPDERFTPASNTKLFTVAAAFHRLGDMSQPDPSMGASVRIEPRGDDPPDIILVGGGDAMLIDAPDCERDCLSDLADMIAANGVKEFGRVIADDTRYPDERWAPGWNQDDLPFRSAAPVSALTVNSNETRIAIMPGPMPGDHSAAEWIDRAPPFQLVNEVMTVADGAAEEDDLLIERAPSSTTVRAYGHIAATSPAVSRVLAIEDPAYSAALRLQTLLRVRGITVRGEAEVRHRALQLSDFDTSASGQASSDPPGVEVARLLPPPLIEDVTFLTKQSQNLHAELLLRRLGLIEGHGSRADGLKVVEAMLDLAGAPRAAWDLSDGSGMSIYNRVTPRLVARFLRWTTTQTWGAAFRDTLPIGGVDGTLSRRFKGTLLEGKIFAKTGTLAGTNALSGFLVTAKGETLIFSVYANDRPSGAGSAIAAMDAALLDIAKSN